MLARARRLVNLSLGLVQPSHDGERRYAGIARATFSALAGKGIAVLVNFISVPLTVGYLGAERFGAWMAVSTLLA